MKEYSLANMLAECQPVPIPYVMIVESDPALARMLQYALKQQMKVGTIFAETMNEALNIAQALCPALFLINHHLVDGDGLILSDLLSENVLLASVPVLLLTTDLENSKKLAEKHGIACVPVSNEPSSLLGIIRNHLSARTLADEGKPYNKL